MTDTTDIPWTEEVESILEQFDMVNKAYYFGSRVKGTNTTTSDIDICIKGDSAVDKSVLDDIQQAFSDSDIPVKTDVIDWHGIKTDFQEKIADDLSPVGWQEVRLSNVGKFARGKSKHRPRDDTSLYGGEYPFIQTGDVKSSSGYLRTYSQTYNEKGLTQSKIWDVGTLCITIAANIAETAILGIKACFPDSIVGYVVNKQKSDVRFIAYLFTCMKRRIQAQAIGSVQDNINLEYLNSIKANLPPLAEQERIAGILSSLDDQIQNLQSMNKTLENMASAIFKSWFVDFDPTKALERGETESDICNTYHLTPEILSHFPTTIDPITNTPKGWEEKGLSEIADFLNGLALQKYPAEENQDYLPVLKIAELRNGISGKTNKASLNIPEKYIIKKGDVIFSWSGSLLLRIWNSQKVALNQHLFKVTSNIYPKWFYYFWTNRHMISFQAIAKSKATTMGHIQRKHLDEAKVIVPDNNILDYAENIIGGLLKKQENNEAQIQTLQNLRDTLLPNLISGKIRV